MRRWVLILILILSVLAISLYALRPGVPFGKRNSSFSIDWTEDIHSILIEEKGGQLLLQKSAEGWEVNNSFTARPSAIDFILTTLRNLEIKSPVSDDLFNQLVKRPNIEPVSVTVSGSKSKKSKFLIYKGLDSVTGSIMKRNLRAKPFFVDLPGYASDPGSHFVSDEKFWMPYHIFKLNPESIGSIKITYKDPLLENISINLSNEIIELTINGTPARDVNIANVGRYISYFTYVPFENWLYDLDHNIKSNLLSSDPEIEFEVGLKDESKIVLRLWIRYSETADGIVPDTDRLFGSLNAGGDIFTVKYFDLDPLIKYAGYFIID